MSTVAEAYFNERSKELLEGLDDEGLVITRGGKPYAKLIRMAVDEVEGAQPRNHSHLIGVLEGKVRVKGDIMSTGVKWEAAEG